MGMEIAMLRIRWALLLMVTLLASVASAGDTNEAIVRRIVAEQLEADESAVGLDTALSAVGHGADALDVIEIFMAIDEKLHVDVSDANVEAVIGPNKTDELPAKTTVRKLTKMVAIARRK
jgi:acyl carrier protein